MCRIGHGSALFGRIVAPRIDVLPYKTGNHSNAGKQTREAQSLRELPALRPSGGAQSFWPWYYDT